MNCAVELIGAARLNPADGMNAPFSKAVAPDSPLFVNGELDLFVTELRHRLQGVRVPNESIIALVESSFHEEAMLRLRGRGLEANEAPLDLF